MAIGLPRKKRLESRRVINKGIRRENGKVKNKERARRDVRMVAALKAAASPADLTPTVKSWVSRQVGKPFAKVKPEDITALIG